MQPPTARCPQSAEDIDAVLGRFQAWSSSRKTKELSDGVRELSYEEALKSSRYRWQARVEAPGTDTAGTQLPGADAPGSEPTERINSGPQPLRETRSLAASQAPEVELSSHDILNDILEDEDFATDTLSLSTIAPEPRTPAIISATGTPASLPVFGTMLTDAVTRDMDTHSGALALVWPATGKSERQVSMSLRVAASEQALIKARAAEAGLSASAYLRQCALEVEQLRAQVQHTLAVIERNSRLALSAGEAPVQAQSPGFSPASGLLTRLRRRIFGGSDTRLTLRA